MNGIKTHIQSTISCVYEGVARVLVGMCKHVCVCGYCLSGSFSLESKLQLFKPLKK